MKAQKIQQNLIDRLSNTRLKPAVKKGSIVNGHFRTHKKTYKELVIARINMTLCVVLGLLLLFSVCSYYFITSNEVKLNTVRKETELLNDENIELQNDLDYLKSYHNVDKTMKGKNILQTANKIMEVSSGPDVDAEGKKAAQTTKAQNKNSFSWSLGY